MQDRVVLDMSKDLDHFFRVEVPAIVANVQGDEPARWGLMSVQHMLEHLVFPLKFITDETEYAVLIPEEKLARQREFLHSAFGMPENFKTPMLPPDQPLPLLHAELDASKQYLLEYLRQFMDTLDAPEFVQRNHPIFGVLNREQWLIFQYKHFAHHFRQFGFLEG